MAAGFAQLPIQLFYIVGDHHPIEELATKPGCRARSQRKKPALEKSRSKSGGKPPSTLLPFLLAYQFMHVMATQFAKLFSFILASVNDPPPPFEPAYRLQCHSCMSPYLEDQFPYISHLYRKPLTFTEKCDHNNFDWRYMRAKNCTDACISLRMNDRLGGRRKFGFMRGCLSDIMHLNRSAISPFDYPTSPYSYYPASAEVAERSGKAERNRDSICSLIRLRDLFVTSDRYAFDPHDHIELCTCIKSFCNGASAAKQNLLLAPWATLLTVATLLLTTSCDWRTMDSKGREESRHCELTVNKKAAVNCNSILPPSGEG